MTDSTRTLETLEIIGGALCLDFANTINSRLHPEHDYLIQYSDLVGWANGVGLLSPTQSNQLQKRAKESEAEAQRALQSALALRDLLYRLFSSAARGTEPGKKDRDAFVASYSEAIARGSLLREGNRYRTTWNVVESFDALLFPVIHSAGELLLSDMLGQVKECPGCGWLFLDTSKNQSRRWCSMNTCGARDKMRRYHKRQRTK